MERLHILDGYGYIFRAFYGIARGRDGGGFRLSTSAGMPTGALYVYARMLIRLYLDHRPERIAVVFDAPGKNFRHELDDQYKATRKETPEDLKAQLPHFKPLTEAFCWPVLSVPGVEADDVIATLVARARSRDWEVTIHTGDKDLMQLVDDHVVVVDSLRNITYDAARVTEKFGVPPHQVADWLALVGDTSDNVPGMAGVGKKTATKLLTAHGDLDGILAAVDEMKGKQRERFSDPEKLDRLRLSRELVGLRANVELDVDLASLAPSDWDGERLRAAFAKLEFQALLESLEPSAPSGDHAATKDAAQDAEPSGAAVAASLPPVLVTAPAELVPLVEAARAANRLAVHVETDGGRSDRAHVVGMAFAAPGTAPVYVPLTHRYLSAPKQLRPDELPAGLVTLLTDPSVQIVGHDVKRLYRTLRGLGIELAGVVCDTMLGAYLLDAGRAAQEVHEVAARFAKVELAPHKTLLGKGKNAIDFESVAVEQAMPWAATAADACLRACEEIDTQLEAVDLTGLNRDVELPLARLLARVEAVGVRLDTAYLRELADRVGARIAGIERRVFEIAGEDINLGSPKQLSALLFDRLGLRAERMKKTKTGFSTDHEVLESMRSAHEIIEPILEHRVLVKLKGTYIDALPPLVNPETGRLHTSFKQAVAATGRLSSTDPNLQNIPIRTELGREIRRAFIASEGKVLVSADYSQVELRILAHLSGDPALVEAFETGADIHTRTAAEVFGMAAADVGPAERRVAKAVNYGLIYGQSEFGLGRALDISRAEARHYIERYFDRFSAVRDYMERVVAESTRTGVSLTVLGRRRLVPELGSRNYQRRQAAKRIAQNTPMQGSGADIMKLAMLRVQELLDERGFDAQMLLTVHDELVFEVATDQAEEVGAAVKHVMEHAYELRVPMVVDVGVADNWAGAH